MEELKMKIEIELSKPTVPESQNLTMEHVWGKHEMESEHIPKIPIVWIHHGMLVATSTDDGLPKRCPVWGDLLKYKSVTIICRPCLEEEVIYWLEYVHGGGSVSRRKTISKHEIALRSDYQCW